MIRSIDAGNAMKKRIVFLDDDVNFLNGIKRVLMGRYDWDIVTFSDVDSMFRQLENNGADVVISDYRMPGTNGLAILGRIKDEYPSVRRILLSGQATNEVYNEASIIAERYLEKPCEADMIIQVIRELTGE